MGEEKKGWEWGEDRAVLSFNNFVLDTRSSECYVKGRFKGDTDFSI